MPPGFPPGLEAALQQAKAFAERMQRLREEVQQRTVEGSAGGGMVRVVADGAGRLREVHIEPQVLAANDREMLQDLVVAAANQALGEAKRMVEETMRSAGGLPFMGLENLLAGLGGFGPGGA